MIADGPRMRAYAEALKLTIRSGDVVVDIGTGTGVFALLACRYGARRVFAIEPSDAIIVAKEIVAANGYARRVEFIQAFSTEVELPEPANVVVSDLRGILPLYGRHLPAIADARARFLAPGGTLVPRIDTLRAALIEAPDLHRGVRASWNEDPPFDMSAAERFAANEWRRASVREEQVVTEAAHCGDIDYASVQQPDLSFHIRLRATRRATAHGLCLWFDSLLADGVRLSNAPGPSSLIYGQAFFPWPRPVALAPGAEIGVHMSAHLIDDSYVWAWDSSVESDAAQFRQSDFFASPLSAMKVRRYGASHVARLRDDARIDRLALTLMDEGKPLGDVARELAQRFPLRFARWEDALTVVGELSARYGV